MNWDHDDQDKALAWYVWEQTKCPGCGTHPDEWEAPDGSPAIPPPYEGHVVLCFGCQERHRTHKHFMNDEIPGQHMIFVRADPSEYDQSLWNIEAEPRDEPS